MKTIDYTENITDTLSFPPYFQLNYADSRLLFFDIETTGFAAAHTTLYLIGILWYEDNKIHIRQWFNEDGYSEQALLCAFNDFSRHFDCLVHFNGLGFDLPYLRTKHSKYQSDNLIYENLQQIDIYRLIRPYKDILSLDSLKQTAVEDYLGITRNDTYSGKELIHIYQRYVARPNEKEEQLLLLHNHDDLLGMPQVSVILNYKAFFEQMLPYNIQLDITPQQLTIRFNYDSSFDLPKRIALTRHNLYLNASEQQAQLCIPIIHTTLPHYFDDYKNYYYLPKEDMAIHKSVATYVEPSRRIKATKNTSYIKQTDDFIPCFTTDAFDIYKEDPHSTEYYQTLQSLASAPQDLKIIYIQSLLNCFAIS